MGLASGLVTPRPRELRRLLRVVSLRARRFPDGLGQDYYERAERLSVFLRKERSDRGKSRLPSKVNAIIETAIKKFYLPAEQPDVAAVIEERDLALSGFVSPRGVGSSIRRRFYRSIWRTSIITS